MVWDKPIKPLIQKQVLKGVLYLFRQFTHSKIREIYLISQPYFSDIDNPLQSPVWK